MEIDENSGAASTSNNNSRSKGNSNNKKSTQQSNSQKKCETKSSSSRKKDSNAQKLPKYCFLCSKSSRVGPLAECGYCCLYFHLDCLNPPLCSMPKDPWMCPNHADHFLEDHLLDEINDENLKLRIDDDLESDENMVKLKFMNKIKNIKRLNEIYKHCHLKSSAKASIPVDSIIYGKVPDAIKQSYANPVKLKDLYKSIFKLHEENTETTCSKAATESDAEIWLSAIACLSDLSSKNDSTKSKQNGKEVAEAPMSSQERSINESSPKLPAHNYCKQAIKPRAILQCTNKDAEKKVFNMPYRNFRIGCSDSCDINLRQLKNKIKCRFLSDKHAEIYYDDYTSHFELLNYSEHGTLVDNVLYANDLSAITNDTDETGGYAGKMMSSHNYATFDTCECRSSYTDVFKGQCWEGAAILNHGTHLKFGCYEFIFSIVDYNSI